jgi:hypothetical protein
VASIRLAVAVVLVALVCTGAQAGLGQTRAQTCNWGASSITGELVNGRFVVTAGPSTSGCIPTHPAR